MLHNILMVHRLTMACAVLWVGVFLAGCHSGGKPPQGWTASSAAPTTQASQNHVPRLQVIICYGLWLSNHAALRLEVPALQTLFWDPGGYFAEKQPQRVRYHDLFLQEPPTLEEYWNYRWRDCREPVMEVFEWDLPPDTATRLRTHLVEGVPADQPGGPFASETQGTMCAMAVSNYLRRFFNQETGIARRHFWPHDLAKRLWRSQPTRVWVYATHRPPQCLIRP